MVVLNKYLINNRLSRNFMLDAVPILFFLGVHSKQQLSSMELKCLLVNSFAGIYIKSCYLLEAIPMAHVSLRVFIGAKQEVTYGA